MFRTLSLILVLTFATGTVVHAVQVSDMAVGMAMTEDGAMPGCDGCGGGNDDNGAAAKLNCSPACVAPAVAILVSDTVVAVKIAGESMPPVADESTGLPTLIDPYPPRSSVLN